MWVIWAFTVGSGLRGGLAGWALLATLERVRRRAAASWTVGAVVAFVVSLAGPLAGVTTAARVALACLHLLVVAVLVIGLRRSAP